MDRKDQDPEDPVDEHGVPDTQHAHVQYKDEHMCKTDTENPYGDNGNDHDPVPLWDTEYASNNQGNRSQCRLPMVPWSGNARPGPSLLYIRKELFTSL